MRKVFLNRILMASLLITSLALGGCGGKQDKQPAAASDNYNGFPVTVVDSFNNSVTVEKVPERIISLSPDNTEILFALGLGDRVVGVTNYCDYPAEAKDKPKIGGFADPSVELIVKARPDLVLANTIHEKAVKQLKDLGITVFARDARDTGEVLEKIRLAGRITGSASQAQLLTSSMEEKILKIREKVDNLPDSARPRVYFEIWHDPLTTGGGRSFLNDIVKTAGGANVAAGVDKDWIVFSNEVLLEKDPQVIFYVHHFTSGQSAEDIKKRQGWGGISAVKNGRIYMFPDENLVVRPGPRIVEGLEIMAAMLHPELFGGK
jgi:iron complex transport system substrate-binding protein